MKKALSLLLVVALILGLAVGCASNTEPASTKAVILKDGKYYAEGQPDSRGWKPVMQLIVADGKITEVQYNEVAGLKKSQDLAYHISFKSKNSIDLLAAYKTIQDSLIANQDSSKIDGYTGATKASDNFKILAAQALINAKDGDSYKDGSYVAVGEADEKGWVPQVSITIEEGRIANAAYDEVSTNVFVNKSQDTTYLESFLGSTGIDLTVVYNELQASLVEEQDAEQIDAYTGATGTTNSFIELARKALELAIDNN